MAISRVWIDQELCSGDATCLEACPEVFQILPGESVASVNAFAERYLVSHDTNIRCAAECCPTQCIHIDGEADEGQSFSWMARLKTIIPPPDDPTSPLLPEAHSELQASLGTELPTDFCEFSRTYGSGMIRGKKATGLGIWNAGHSGFVSSLESECERLQMIRGAEKSLNYPFAIFPERNGMFCFGGDECGTGLYWEVSPGRSPNKWPIVVYWTEGTYGMSQFPMSLTEFLVSILERRIELPCWPRPWFLDGITFAQF